MIAIVAIPHNAFLSSTRDYLLLVNVLHGLYGVDGRPGLQVRTYVVLYRTLTRFRKTIERLAGVRLNSTQTPLCPGPLDRLDVPSPFRRSPCFLPL